MDVGTRITQEQLSIAFQIKTVSLKANLQKPNAILPVDNESVGDA
jgi:hypothetical protein